VIHNREQTGARLGYLTDREYQFLSHEVIRLRTTGELQTHKEDELRGKLLNRLSGNKPMLERYLAHARQRFPTKSVPERLQGLLDDFESWKIDCLAQAGDCRRWHLVTKLLHSALLVVAAINVRSNATKLLDMRCFMRNGAGP
jgi:hypothetical protein